MNPAESGKPDVSLEQKNDEQANAYILSLAERIKALRIRRGMTRKLLSQHSMISERYLSQVESGQANISVTLLWRIAQAMDVEVQELLPDYEESRLLPGPLLALLRKMDADQLEKTSQLIKQQVTVETIPCRGIALIGLRGAGKSALGQLLSEKTGVPFFDLVAVIQELSGLEVGDLFSLGGQKTYRRLEQQALDHVLKNHSNAIIEAGGSLITQADTYQKLLNHYHTVWVKAEPGEHMQRVIAQGDFRPMQGNDEAMEDLKTILKEREKEHRSAHYILNTSDRDLQSCLEELLSHAKLFLRA